MMRRIGVCLLGVVAVSMHCMTELKAQPPPDNRERTFKSGDYVFYLPGVLRVREFVPGQEDVVYAVVMLYVTTPQEVLGFGQPKGIEAIGSDNSPLTPIPQRIRGELTNTDVYPFVARGGGNQSRQLIQIALKLPEGVTDDIKLLKGVVPVTLPKGKAELRIDNPLEGKGKSFEHEGKRITLKAISYAEERLEVRLAGEGEFNNLAVIIITSDGNETRFRSRSSSWTNVDGKNIFEFTGSSDGVKDAPRAIVLRSPAAREVIEVPFEFHGIPLP